MKTAVGFLLLFVGGAALGLSGVSVTDWNWWAIIVPLTLGSALL